MYPNYIPPQKRGHSIDDGLEQNGHLGLDVVLLFNAQKYREDLSEHDRGFLPQIHVLCFGLHVRDQGLDAVSYAPVQVEGRSCKDDRRQRKEASLERLTAE